MLNIDRGSFAGHETFPFRYAWLRKGVQFVSDDPQGFGRDDAMVRLGVGKNMVSSIRHWSLVTGMLEEDPTTLNNRGRVLCVTGLGRQLLGPDGWDPYMEDPATLWLLHWQIASAPETATTWFWVFNHLPQPEFTRPDLMRWLMSLVSDKGWTRVSEASLKRDIDCCIRTYVPARPSKSTPVEDTLDCPLGELGLIREFGSRGTYVLSRGEQPTLPDEVFAYAVARFLAERKDSLTKTVPLDAIAFAPGAPGRVFCLTEDALLLRLERLDRCTRGDLSFDETAGLRQLLVRSLPDPHRLLTRYYEHGGTDVVGAWT